MATTPVLDMLASPNGCKKFINLSISFLKAATSTTNDLFVLSKISELYFLHIFIAFFFFFR